MRVNQQTDRRERPLPTISVSSIATHTHTLSPCTCCHAIQAQSTSCHTGHNSGNVHSDTTQPPLWACRTRMLQKWNVDAALQHRICTHAPARVNRGTRRYTEVVRSTNMGQSNRLEQPLCETQSTTTGNQTTAFKPSTSAHPCWCLVCRKPQQICTQSKAIRMAAGDPVRHDDPHQHWCCRKLEANRFHQKDVDKHHHQGARQAGMNQDKSCTCYPRQTHNHNSARAALRHTHGHAVHLAN